MKRNYCCCFVLNPTILDNHLQLLAAATEGREFASVYPDINQCYKPDVEIFIRKQWLLSRFTHTLKVPDIDAPAEETAGLLTNAENAYNIYGPYVAFSNIEHRVQECGLRARRTGW